MAAFVDEVGPLVDAGRFLTEAGRGVATDDLAALRRSRPPARRPTGIVTTSSPRWAWPWRPTSRPVVLAGRSVAIEGFDGAGSAWPSQLVARGARVVAVATAEGTAARPEGSTSTALAAAWDGARRRLCQPSCGAEVGGRRPMCSAPTPTCSWPARSRG